MIQYRTWHLLINQDARKSPTLSLCKSKILLESLWQSLNFCLCVYSYDQDKDRHYVIKEIETTQDSTKHGLEPEILRETRLASVSPSGALPTKYNLKVSGMMNYKQR